MYENTKFINLLKRIGLKVIITGTDFIVAAVIAILIIVGVVTADIAEKAVKAISPILVGLSAALVSIIIAGLAIISAISDPKFVIILKEKDSYDKLLFYFWMAASICGLSMLLNIVSLLVVLAGVTECVVSLFLFISLFMASYAVTSTISLVGTTMRFGIYRSEFIMQEHDKEKEEGKE